MTVRFRKTDRGRGGEGGYAICAPAVLRLAQRGDDARRYPAKHKRDPRAQLHASTKVLLSALRFWEEEGGIVGGATPRTCRSAGWSTRRTRRPRRLPRGAAGQLHVGPGRRPVGRDGPGRRGWRRRWRTWRRSGRRSSMSSRGGPPRVVRGPVGGRAFALFEPGQQAELHADIVKPEGRIHFAGEHCSLWHAWIQGALESGVRAAREINEGRRPGPDRRSPAAATR